MSRLSGLRVAVLATDGFEESELTDPVSVLRQSGATVDVISLESQPIQGFKHLQKATTVKVDRTINEAPSNDYDALLLPGGANNADRLRVEPRIKDFVREFNSAGKPMAIICHAPWLLVSAEIVRGRKLTSYHTIQDDIRNAGGRWEDSAVVEDGNWVTSRQPKDLPLFVKAMLQLFEKSRQPTHA
jgi:deglycase